MSGSDILHGEEPPGEWRHGSTGGGHISFRLPEGKTPEDYGEIRDYDVVEVVIQILGKPEEDLTDRPTEVWVTHYNPKIFVMNAKSVSTELGEATGVEAAAEIAYEYMDNNRP